MRAETLTELGNRIAEKVKALRISAVRFFAYPSGRPGELLRALMEERDKYPERETDCKLEELLHSVSDQIMEFFFDGMPDQRVASHGETCNAQLFGFTETDKFFGKDWKEDFRRATEAVSKEDGGEKEDKAEDDERIRKKQEKKEKKEKDLKEEREAKRKEGEKMRKMTREDQAAEKRRQDAEKAAEAWRKKLMEEDEKRRVVTAEYAAGQLREARDRVLARVQKMMKQLDDLRKLVKDQKWDQFLREAEAKRKCQ
jgi:hypothetical protein